MADKNYLDSDGVLYVGRRLKQRLRMQSKTKLIKSMEKVYLRMTTRQQRKQNLQGSWMVQINMSILHLAGNKHIPSGGSSGQILRWGADGATIGALIIIQLMQMLLSQHTDL